ncbi:white collar 2 type of transcription factor [Elasticomyces elasticus]|nr:white collar 2 type of transcription factor [Elasticomyces elasticus]KAK4968450.1 white collar 2 type of transcription factor [Elasticomyces elasticus]
MSLYRDYHSGLGGTSAVLPPQSAYLPQRGDVFGGLGSASAAEDLSMDVGMLGGLDMDMNVDDDMLDMQLPQGGYGLNAAGSEDQSMGGPMAQVNGGIGSNGGGLDVGLVSAPMEDLGANGVGAGPLPTGFGMSAQPNSSTLTEFTKRRNWSQRIIEELKDFLHILTPDGRILYVSPSCRAITGYEPQTLVGKFIGEYVHPDDSGIFMREFNESIASGNNLRFFYRFKKDDGTYIIFECDGHPHISLDEPTEPPGYNASHQNGNQAGGMCRGFFMMARPYPTKNAALLDSFLEHKIENERLMRRVEELKREEQEENAEQNLLDAAQLRATSQVPSRIPPDLAIERAAAPNYEGMPPPAKPPVSNTALTRQNLDSALLAQRPDSIADKMSRYEADSTHLESIELMTGLRYRDGERSHGISTGDTSPALIRGDAGIAILLDRDKEGNKKEKKKQKVAEEYVCADCGTLDSPEWRKGPRGPKTLCNACGLRWAKKEKKRGGPDDGKMDISPVGMHGMGQADLAMTPGMVPAFAQPPAMPMQTSTGSGN